MPAAQPYYLDNFHSALDWIVRRYDDLLDEGERAFIGDFAALPLPSRALLVRMLMRQGVHFRASKLQYDEIGCPLAAAAPLLSNGWLDADPSLSLASLFALSTRPQLLRLLPELASRATLRKSDWLAVLTPQYPVERAYSDWVGDRDVDHLFHVTVAPLCERLRLIFFGNLYQDWSTFVLADLGIFQYEKVAFPVNARAFQQREDVDAYIALQRSRDALTTPEALASDVALRELLGGLAAVSTQNPWIAQRRAKCLFLAGQACERMQYWDTALAAYGQTAWPGARHRAMRVLERCGREDEALALAIDAARAPENEEEAQRVERLRTRLMKRLPEASLPHGAMAGPAIPTRQRGRIAPVSAPASTSTPASAACLPDAVSMPMPVRRMPITRALLVLPPNANRAASMDTIHLAEAAGTATDGDADAGATTRVAGVSVEFRVLDAMSRPDAPVFYVENTLLGGLFGLLCWDALFAPLPGAFFHPFQRSPADLDAPDFVVRRAALFDRAIARLDDRTYRRTILTHWRTKSGIQAPFVHWGALRRDVLLLALRCIPAAHLKRCFQRLLEDPRGNRTGLPDLIRFWPGKREYEMIEVKGPGDRLQDNQLRWLAYFAAHDIPARVVDVRWDDALTVADGEPEPMAQDEDTLKHTDALTDEYIATSKSYVDDSAILASSATCALSR